MHTSYPKDKLNILLLENISAEAVHAFQESGYSNTRNLKEALSEDELLEAIKGVHVLGIRSKTQITKKVLEAADKLLAIGCFCIGTNQVDKKSATQKGISVFNSPYSNTRSVAELVIGAAIMLIRRIPDKNKAAHEGIWLKESKNSHELRGKTLGVLGYGNIGAQVSVLAESLGMRVVYYDTEKKLPLGNATSKVSIEDVLAVADVITLHLPANKQTKDLINEETLRAVKPGAVLINYARGEVANIEAIKNALDSGLLSGAAVDVYPSEPEKNGAGFECILRGMSNVILTPHIGGSTEEAQVNIGVDVSSKLIQFVESGSTQGSLSIPSLNLPPQEGAHRLLHIHRNVPGVLSEINSVLSDHGVNILGQYLKTNEEVGYVVLDVDKPLNKDASLSLKNVKETIRVRTVY